MKKYLLSLLLCLFWFIGFSNAWTFTIDCNITTSSKVNWFYFDDWSNPTFDHTKCIRLSDELVQFIPSSASYRSLRTTTTNWASTHLQVPYFWKFNNVVYTWVVCWIPEWDTYLMFYLTNTANSDVCVNSGGVLEYDVIDFPFWSQCESQYTSEECQQEYSLMPISSCDSEFCNMNNLCGTSSWDVTWDWNWSALYINDIQFPWKAFIDVTIPDYITWDYSSDETWFNLYVGSGYDVDYINSIVDINSYRPDSSDFTWIFVSGLTLVFPYIILALFIAFMRKLLKRIFKH